MCDLVLLEMLSMNPRLHKNYKDKSSYDFADIIALRGYCTPGQFLDCFCIFLKNYNTLVTSKMCFLLVTFQET